MVLGAGGGGNLSRCVSYEAVCIQEDSGSLACVWGRGVAQGTGERQWRG